MHHEPINRRHFLHTAAVAATATALGSCVTTERGAPVAAATRWPIGCFNRPWTRWGLDVALASIKSAGYDLSGLLSRTRQEPFIGSEATPEYLARLKDRLATSGLAVNMAALHTPANLPPDDAIRDVRRQLDHAALLRLRYVLSFGVEDPAHFASFYAVMRAAAAYGQDRGIQVAVKPHGGSSGAGAEMVRCLERVNHPNFSIWYDAGNIIYYTGKDPVAELEPIVGHVTGFCAKDCAAPRGEVMIQFGDGKVDFKGVFAKLKAGGFNGPIMVECCTVGATAGQTASNARRNREFLERLLS
ncbi:MAG: sugar phosphate isomerase/epimerase [Verrucomicrobia bacterium]|nr:sugar phosphate isomerase/epimerase [Verrucomicrobiota bacterium]